MSELFHKIAKLDIFKDIDVIGFNYYSYRHILFINITYGDYKSLEILYSIPYLIKGIVEEYFEVGFDKAFIEPKNNSFVLKMEFELKKELCEEFLSYI